MLINLLVICKIFVCTVHVLMEDPGEGTGYLDTLLHDVAKIPGDHDAVTLALLHQPRHGLDVEGGAAHRGPGQAQSHSGLELIVRSFIWTHRIG